MTSWFGSGLSQIKGQLTDFTKEMLEDGTVTVEKDGHHNIPKISTSGHLLVEPEEENDVQGTKDLEHVDIELEDKKKSQEILKNNTSKQQSTIVQECVEDLPQVDFPRKGISSSGDELEDKLHHLEKVHEKLTIDLELTHAADKEKARQLQQQQEEINSIIECRDKVLSENVKLKEEKKDLIEQLDILVSERRFWSHEVLDIKQEVKIKEHDTCQIGNDAKSARFDESSNPIQAYELQHIIKQISRDNIPEPNQENCESNSQVIENEISKKLFDRLKEIEQFEMIKSDWQMEKEALEDVLLKLREQIRDKDVVLNRMKMECEKLKKELTDSDKPEEMCHPKDVVSLDNPCTEAEVEKYELSFDVLRRENANKDKVIKEMQSELCSLSKLLEENENLMICQQQKHSDKVKMLKEQIADQEGEINRITQELNSYHTEFHNIVLENEKWITQNLQLLKQNEDTFKQIKTITTANRKNLETTTAIERKKDQHLAVSKDSNEQHQRTLEQNIASHDVFGAENAKFELTVLELERKLKQNLSSNDLKSCNISCFAEIQNHCQELEPEKSKEYVKTDDKESLEGEDDSCQSSETKDETSIRLMIQSHKMKEVRDISINDQQHSILFDKIMSAKNGIPPDASESKQTTLHANDLKCEETDDTIIKNDRSLNESEIVSQSLNFDKLKNELEMKHSMAKDEQYQSPMILENIYKLRKLISQKHSIITQLNIDKLSLLKLLYKHSCGEYGDNFLVHIHNLQKQIKSLQLDKEQVMSVLNEKSRECSSLKTEVHHLMTVVSAEKMALNKLQQDNNDLVKAKDKDENSETHEDMTKEAIQKLSQIIQEKDLEIEALNQKNRTLIEVLQQSSDVGSKISSLLHENDQLLKQIQVFQCDRENIIATLNTKHKESIVYHDELQKLSTMLANEQQRNEKICNDFSGLKKQYDDKQHAFLKMQNEMLNYKRKYCELDKKHKELIKKKHEISAGFNSCTQFQIPFQVESLPDSKGILEKQDKVNIMNAKTLVKHPESTSVFHLESKSEDKNCLTYPHEFEFFEKDMALEQKSFVLPEKVLILRDKQLMINEKQKQITELTSKVHRSEEALRIKETELNNLKKHTENQTFQLSCLQTELTDLQVERNHLFEKHSIILQEMTKLKEDNNKLMLGLNDKEFEISASKERIESLSKLFEEKNVGEKDEMDKMIKNLGKLHSQIQIKKQEQDQSMLALQQQQTENRHLQDEIQRLKEKNHKLSKELDRLRGHLLSIEENYTQDALSREDRERELCSKLAAAEEKASSSTSAIHSVNLQTLQQIETLKEELHSVAVQRDHAMEQLDSARESASHYANSVQNLQMVLEQFQMERETHQNTELDKYQKEIDVYRNKNHQLQEQNYELQVQVNDASDALAAGRRLSEQLDRKEEMVAALREEVQLRESELKKAENDIRLLSVSREARVDKELMRNMILGYFHTPSPKRKEALLLIGRVLDFSESDLDDVNISAKHGWLGGLFKSSSPSTKIKATSSHQSFSELFVSFLERESSPQPSLKWLSDEHLQENTSQIVFNQSVESENNSGVYDESTPIINPFSSPVSAAQPLDTDSSRESPTLESHPLMKPISQSLPVLAGPVSFTECNMSVSPSLIYSQSMLSNSGTILRDVLKQ